MLVVNAGSSSLKLARLDGGGAVTASTTVQHWQGEGHLEPLQQFLDDCGPWTRSAMTAATGGLDLLVLTGGVGEHSWEVRAGLADGLAHLGGAVDAERNRTTTTDADISGRGAAVRIVVVTAREDLEIRRQMVALLGG